MRYIAKISLGLEDIIKESLPKFLKGAGRLSFYDDLLDFEFGGEMSQVLKYPLFSAAFVVIHKFTENETSFRKMSQKLAADYIEIKKSISGFKNIKTFRVRYFTEKGLVSVDEFTKGLDEQYIQKRTSLRPNRIKPDIEFYFVSRRDSQNYFAVRIEKYSESEKQKAGELKPEIAYATVYKSDIQKGDVVLDVFGKYGALAFTANKYFKDIKVVVGDWESKMVTDMKSRAKAIMGRQPEVIKLNPVDMQPIVSESINRIITEMPTNKHEGATEELYSGFLKEATRVIKPNGSIFLLVQEPQLLMQSLEEHTNLVVKSQIILKSSKVYNLYQLKKR